jgi:hypothetical protein
MNTVAHHCRGGEEGREEKKARESIMIFAGSALFGMRFVTLFYLLFYQYSSMHAKWVNHYLYILYIRGRTRLLRVGGQNFKK